MNIPDATVFELFVDDEPLYLPTARLREYARILDMRNGVLTRELLWSTPSGKHVRVRSWRLVSLEHRHVAAMSYEVTVDQPSPVVIVSRVVKRNNSTGRNGDPRAVSALNHSVLQDCFGSGGMDGFFSATRRRTAG